MIDADTKQLSPAASKVAQLERQLSDKKIEHSRREISDDRYYSSGASRKAQDEIYALEGRVSEARGDV